MAKMEGELSEKTSLVERLESELKQLRKRSDEARTREQKLAHELQEVSACEIKVYIRLNALTLHGIRVILLSIRNTCSLF